MRRHSRTKLWTDMEHCPVVWSLPIVALIFIGRQIEAISTIGEALNTSDEPSRFVFCYVHHVFVAYIRSLCGPVHFFESRC